MAFDREDTNELLARVGQGDCKAVDRVLERHRERLRQMVSVRMDLGWVRGLMPRTWVQEALADAADRLLSYLRDRPLPFYLWLRELAWRRLVDLTRAGMFTPSVGHSVAKPFHTTSSVTPDASALHLARHWVSSGTRYSGHIRREDQKRVVRNAPHSSTRPIASWWCRGTWSNSLPPEVAAVLNVSGLAPLRVHPPANANVTCWSIWPT